MGDVGRWTVWTFCAPKRSWAHRFGKYVAGATLAIWASIAGASVVFDGANDWATAALTTQRQDPFTILVKVKVPTTPASLEKVVGIAASPSSDINQYSVNVTSTVGQWHCAMQDFDAITSNTSVTHTGSHGNVWVSVICEVLATDTGRTMTVETTTNGGTVDRIVANTLDSIRIGASFDDGADFEGNIAEVVMLNRLPTEAEKTSYVANECTANIFNDEIVYYSLKQGDANALNNMGSDATGDLTLVGNAALAAAHPTMGSCGGGGGGTATVVVEDNTPDTTLSTNISGSFTPAANSTVVIGVCMTGTADAATTATSSVGGQTYSRYATYVWGSGHQFVLFIADQAATNVAQTATITAPTDDWTGTNIMIASIEALGAYGSAAVEQAAPEDGFSAAATPDITFGSAVATGNPTVLFACNLSNPAGITPPTNWTEGGDIGYTSVDAGGEWAYRDSGFTGTGVSWGSTSATNGEAYGFEFDASGGGGGTPSFDTVMSCSQFNTLTMRCTYNANADADRIHTCVMWRDRTAPANGAAVEAGTNCIGTATELTTGADDTIDISMSDPPQYVDVYGVLEVDDNTYTAVDTELNETLTPPDGFQYVDRSGTASTGDAFFGASPAIADGDTMMVSLKSDCFTHGLAPVTGHAVTINVDGSYEIIVGGETVRQIIHRRFADYSANAWSDPEPVPLANNNQAGTYVCDDIEDLIFEKDADVNYPLDSCWNDPEADSQTHAVTNMPPGGSLSASELIIGAFTTYGNYNTVDFTVYDAYNASNTADVTIYVGLILPDIDAWLLDELLWKERSIFADEDSFFNQAMGRHGS
jgi:hypothetical protein